MTTRVCIADDHPLFGLALEGLVRALPAQFAVERVQDVTSLHKRIGSEDPIDLLLLDLHMPGAVGFSTLNWVRGQRASLPVIIVSANTHPETVRRALDHGAAAFLSKSADEQLIDQTIHAVLAGERGLTPNLTVATQGESLSGLDTAEAVSAMTAQQFRVASMLVEGQLNKQIAWELGVKEATIKAHLTEIFRKLGVNSRTQAVLLLSKLLPETNEDHQTPVSNGSLWTRASTRPRMRRASMGLAMKRKPCSRISCLSWGESSALIIMTGIAKPRSRSSTMTSRPNAPSFNC